MNKRVGWFNNEWANLDNLKIPICDRGLTLGDGIFETILICQGQPQLLSKHLDRWQKSAELLHMAQPPSEERIRNLIFEGIELISLHKNNAALRLNWTRGDNDLRGINISKEKANPSNHRFWIELNFHEPYFHPVSALISSHEKRNANSQISRCKTINYIQSINARQEAKLLGYDEALLQSTNSEICCGATANLIVKRQGQFLTPRLESGCLPGIMRQQGLDTGLLIEAKIDIEPQEGDEWLLINSLSCQAINQVKNKSLQTSTNPKTLWWKLLKTRVD